MNLRSFAIASALVIVLAGAGRPATADPIQLVGGILDVNGTVGSLQLQGERDFTLTARVSTTDGVFQPWLQCVSGGCTPGTVIDLAAYWVGLSLRSATATLNGETFTNVGGAVSTSSAAVRFAGSVVAPPPGGDAATVVAPFVFAGQFSHVTGSVSSIELLQGSGTATLSLQRSAGVGLDPAWTFTAARYQLDPLPEPATLILTGGGVLVIAIRRMRRVSTV